MAFKNRLNDHPLYDTWIHMRLRCSNPANPKYARYGGRGIQVCPEWENDFFRFVADMGPRPPGHSLDRRDNDGDYGPSNCRWATGQMQMQNTRRNRLLTIGDRTQCLTVWAREVGLKRSTIEQRLSRGWTTGAAVLLPLRN